MAYSEKARQYAFDTVEQRRISSAEKSAEKKARLLKEISELQALEYEIASIGVSAARAMITESNDDIKKALSSQLDELKAKQVAILKKTALPRTLFHRFTSVKNAVTLQPPMADYANASKSLFATIVRRN